MNTTLTAISSRNIYALLLFLLFLTAALYRLTAPGAPFIDPDINGYLKPGLFAITHSEFQRIEGRSFVYPGFVYLILYAFHDFKAITTAQHLLGLASGGILLTCWNASRRLVTTPMTSCSLHRLLGIPVAAVFLFNTNEFRFEHSLRPEAIFPFFAVLSMLLNIQFIKHRWLEPNCNATLLFGSLNVFTAFLLSFLKPSFFLASLTCTLPVCIYLLDKKEPSVRKFMVLGISAFSIAVFLFFPEQHFNKNDPFGKAFLPTTLFVIHAKIIRDQMLNDIKSDAKTPYSTPFLQRTFDLLDQEIAISRHTGKYRSLDYDPDYLMYRESFNRKFSTYFGEEKALDDKIGFYYFYFRRAWTHQPGRMLKKVLTQLAIFYNSIGHISPYKAESHVALREKYLNNVTVLALAQYFAPIEYAPLLGFMWESEQLVNTQARITQPGIVSLLGTALWRTFSLCFILGIAMAIMISKDRTLRAKYGLFAATLMLLYTYSAANNLCIAIVHSLEIARYSTNELIYCLLPHCLTIWLAVEVVWFHRSRRNPPELAAPVPEV